MSIAKKSQGEHKKSLLRRVAWPIIIVAILGFIGAAKFGSGVVGVLSNDQSSYIKNTQSYDVNNALSTKFASNATDATILFTAKDSLKVTDPGFEAAVTKSLAKLDRVTNISTFYSTKIPQFVSSGKRQTYAVITMSGTDDQKYAALQDFQKNVTSDVLHIDVGGFLMANREVTAQVEHDLRLAEAISLPILAIILVFVFRGVIAAALPLVLGVFSIVGSLSLVRVLAGFTEIDQYSVNIITILSLGLAVDYCLLMVARFREELAVQPTVHEAVVKTIRTAGRTILFSGITVIVSLLSLSFFPVTLLRSISLGGASAVALTLVAALIILPCILLLLGHRINNWRLGMPVRSHTKHDAPNLWSRIAGWVTRRPIISLLGSLLIVGFIASPLMNVHFIARDYRALPEGTSAKIVTEALTNNFGVGQSPVIALVTVQDIASEKGLATLLDASSQIKNIHGVSSVVGLSTISPGASAAELYNLAYGPASKHNPQLPALKKQYVAGNTAQLLVTYTDGGPSDSTAQAIVREVRALKSDSFSVIVGGQPAVQYDLVATILTYLPYALATIVITIMIFLCILLRSILIPIQAIVINSFAILASLGIVVWIFQEGNLTNISWLVKTGGLDVTTPLLVCTIAFGLSMDYAVFLYSRIHEEYLKTKDTTLAIVNGVRLTGSIITEAATLFFIVVIAFATSAIPMLQQIGLGMAIAVIIDAFFVRIVIVPAVMKLVGRANWL